MGQKDRIMKAREIPLGKAIKPVPARNCIGCYFTTDKLNCRVRGYMPCADYERKDGIGVKFILIDLPKEAQASLDDHMCIEKERDGV